MNSKYDFLIEKNAKLNFELKFELIPLKFILLIFFITLLINKVNKNKLLN